MTNTLERERLTALALNAKLAYASEDEILWLQQWARNRDGSTVMIIGAGPGVMTLALLEARAYMRVFIVDILPAYTLVEHVRQGGFEPERTIRVFQADSAAFAAKFWDANIHGKPIDLLIVDGDHSEDGVRRDIEQWLPLVAPGGLIFFHDYEREGAEWGGVKRAVDALCADLPLVGDLDSTRIVRKV